MSFLLRATARRTPIPTVFKRCAHKKASIQVRLNDYVEGLGIKDDIVSIRPGLMRNVLYPSGKAQYIETYQGPRDRQRELERAQMAEKQQANATLGVAAEASRRAEHFKQLKGGLASVQSLTFKRAVVPESTATFGSVTVDDLVNALKEQHGLSVDKSWIDFGEGRIKALGEHIVHVRAAENQSPVAIKVLVEAS